MGFTTNFGNYESQNSDYTVAIGGTTGVFVETEKADFNQLYEALVES